MFQFKIYNKLRRRSCSPSDFEGAPVSAHVLLQCWRGGELAGSRGDTAGCSAARCLFLCLRERQMEKATEALSVSLAWKQDAQERWFTSLSWHQTGNKPGLLETRWPGEAKKRARVNAQVYITLLELGWCMITAVGDRWLWNTSVNHMVWFLLLVKVFNNQIRRSGQKQDELWRWKTGTLHHSLL